MKQRASLIVGAMALLVVPLSLALACDRDGAGTRGRAAETRGSTAATAAPMQVSATDAVDGAVSVLVSGMRFQPEVIRIKAGQSVAWTFNDPGLVHSVSAFDGSFDSGLRESGTFVVRFDRPGTYCYQCLPHPGRNLCEQGAVSTAAPLILAAQPLNAAATILNRLGGGGHMQGKVIVEE